MIAGAAVAGVTFALVLVVIGIHYEALSLITTLCRRLPLGRPRVGIAVVAAAFAHIVEATVFGIGIHGLVVADLAAVAGATGFRDHIYFSFATYSSLGYGDLVPLGALRLLAGVEAVTGLVLIAWTASFTYYEMQRYWRDA